MRIRRIAIRNFRGVEACDVHFPPRGVTIIEGPNEVGKSSLAEALELLFEYPHDSQRRSVKSVKPVHRDAGPEVEAELTTGPYHIVFSKRWARDASTSLEVMAPSPESLTGRAAHERMQEILDETLDRDLFKALRFIQGDKIDQTDLQGSTSLIRALDQAATGGLADPKAESTLWEAVEKEYLRYFTATGKVTQERERLGVQLREAAERAENARRDLAGLEETDNRCRTIAREHAALEQRLHEADQALDRERDRSKEIADLELKVATCRTEAAEAESAAQRARDAYSERAGKVGHLRELQADIEALKEKLEVNEAALARAEEERLAAEESYQRSQDASSAAEAALDQIEAAEELERARISLGLLSNRQKRVRESHEEEASAAGLLESCSEVTETVRARVEKAWRGVLEARVRSEAASPTIEVEALSDVELTIDETPERLAQGDRRKVTVVTHRTIRLDDRVVLHASTGAPGRDLHKELAEAQHRLDELVQEHALDPEGPLADADKILESRRSAKERIATARKRRADALEDLTEEELGAKLLRAQAAVEAGERPATDGSSAAAGTSSRAETGEPARAAPAKEELAAARRDARREEEDAKARLASVDTGASNYRVQVGTTRELLKNCNDQYRRATDELDEARAAKSDEELENDLSRATVKLTEARSALDIASAAYEAHDPERVKATLQNQELLTQRLEKELRELDKLRVETETVLKERRAADLQEAIDAAEPDAARLEREHRDQERRAAAARLLYETFSSKRNESRRAYVAPYSEQINRMAKLLFGPEVRITINPDDFSVSERYLNHATVPFEDLSTGAREQLAVLARLACAILVNPPATEDVDEDSGVPVILDDALGYSDPERLQMLGVAFSEAARMAQVIVMTSTPERYARIGNATVVRLPQPTNGQ